LIFSGLFLGWSLGANDGGNIFGPAISTRMLRFRFATILASIFVVLGAVFQGGGASQTLSSLGSVNMISGSFTVAIAAALSLFFMLRLNVPVSSSQAVVGAIIGWNLFSGSFTDISTVMQIVSTWLITPLLCCIFAVIFYHLFNSFFHHKAISLFKLDYFTRAGYIVLVSFSAYSLGANNIANVMGMFVETSPFTPITLFNRFLISSQTQLFFLGGVSIAVGIMTRSMSNAKTVGNAIFKMSPITGFIAVLSTSLVMFLFSSKQLQLLLQTIHLPTLPPVPISSSQAIIGSIIGIGIVHNIQNLHYRKLGKIALGVVINPILACMICFFSLFFVQNVFDQQVYQPTTHIFSQLVIEKLHSEKIEQNVLEQLVDREFPNAKGLRQACSDIGVHKIRLQAIIAKYSEYHPMYVNTQSLFTIQHKNHFADYIFNPLIQLENKSFNHKWELIETLSNISDVWKYKPEGLANHFYNSELDKRYELLFKVWKSSPQM